MQLPPGLRRSLQAAYGADFGRELTDDEATALGQELLDLLGPVFATRESVHRSLPRTVDESANKREPEGPTRSLV